MSTNNDKRILYNNENRIFPSETIEIDSDKDEKMEENNEN